MNIGSTESDKRYEVVVKHYSAGVLHMASFKTRNQAHAFLWRVGMDCLLIAAGHKLNVARLSMTDMNPGSAFPHSARRIS